MELFLRLARKVPMRLSWPNWVMTNWWKMPPKRRVVTPRARVRNAPNAETGRATSTPLSEWGGGRGRPTRQGRVAATIGEPVNVAAEIQGLRQVYENHSTELSRYAEYLVTSDIMRVKRFFRGLANPYFITLSPLVGSMNYSEIVNASYGIEAGLEERRENKDVGKKKIQGAFFEGPSYSGVLGFQKRQQAQSGGTTHSKTTSKGISASRI
ncbi:hypothetical protein PIB30_096729 [Stylosanthes scabra]|uniref:Uncharacterized protein n=1 Tax=Stylosanthes scabra TaxID=79078 RepID=A0ABU6VUH3_9FABA|nr:hypothetical protein [Stylosanthes scabra]